MARALAVAGLTAGDEELGHVLDLFVLRFNLLAILIAFDFFLLLFDLGLIFPASFHSLYEVSDKLFALFHSEVDKVAEFLVDGGGVLGA